MTRRTFTRHIREAILWVGATLGLLCIGWTAAMFTFGLTPLVFTSGSMSPAIGAGDLAFARTIDADEIARDDVVSVINDKGTRITHRVTNVDRLDDGGAVLQLQGDANDAPDQQAYTVKTVERVLFDVPKAGYVVSAVGSKWGMFAGGLLVAAALIIAFRRHDDLDADSEDSIDPADREIEPEPTHDSRGNLGPRVKRVATVGACVVALGLAGTTAVVQATQAAWTDTGDMGTDPVAADSLPAAPATMTCSNSLASATLSWPNTGNRNTYRYAYVIQISDNATFVNARTEIQQPAAGASRSFTLSWSLLGDWFTGNEWHVRVRAAYVDGSGTVTWQSSDYREWTVNRAPILSSFSCGRPIN